MRLTARQLTGCNDMPDLQENIPPAVGIGCYRVDGCVLEKESQLGLLYHASQRKHSKHCSVDYV